MKNLLTMIAVMAALYLYPQLTNAQESGSPSPQELLALTYAGPELDKNIEKARTLKYELEETVALAEKLKTTLDSISVPSANSLKLASASSEDLLDTLNKTIEGKTVDPGSVKCTNPLCRCKSCTCNNCGCNHIARTTSSPSGQVLLNGKPIDLDRYLTIYGNGPTVGVRGMTIDAHLGHHGFSNFSHLSNSEKFRLHTAAHNAGVPASIRTTMNPVTRTTTHSSQSYNSSYGSSYGNCANGRCRNNRRRLF